VRSRWHVRSRLVRLLRALADRLEGRRRFDGVADLMDARKLTEAGERLAELRAEFGDGDHDVAYYRAILERLTNEVHTQ
jgi:hypothetical protein